MNDLFIRDEDGVSSNAAWRSGLGKTGMSSR